MSIGSTIKELREMRGISQQELGQQIGVSDKAVSSWELETKTPRMDSIQKLADFFGVTKSYIIEESIETITTDIPIEQQCIFNNIFAERLKALRKESNMNQSEFADIFNVTQQAVAYWEKGSRTPNFDILVQIADYFDVPLDFLFGRTDNKHSESISNNQAVPPAQSDNELFDEDMRSIIRARNSMTDKEKAKMMNVLKAVFDELFSE